jgi:hypothetical protein
MSLEKRNHKTYLYYKRRVNGRITAVYLGRGDLAEKLAKEISHRSREKWKKRAKSRETRERVEQLETPVAQLDPLVADLTRAALLLAGCYTHKGQWRKKRAKPRP